MKESELVQKVCKYATLHEYNSRHRCGKAVVCSEKEGDSWCICTENQVIMGPFAPEYSYRLQKMFECEYRKE